MKKRIWKAVPGALRTAVVVCGLASSLALAQSYPARPIRMIIPFGPGGSTDLVGRLTAQKADLGQTIIVENRPGAGAAIGYDFVARADPDGYVICMGGPALSSLPLFLKSYTHNVLQDFTAISLLSEGPSVLVVNSEVPVKSVAELVAYARANPGKLNIGDSGSAITLDIAAMQQAMGVKFFSVPYNGSAQAVPAVVANQVQVLLDPIVTSRQHIASGKVRALAVGSLKRFSGLPDLPTLAESGLPGFETSSIWFGLVGPAKLPPEVVNKLNVAFNKTLSAADVKARLNEFGQDPVGSTPAQMREYLERNVAYYTKFAQVAGIKPE